MNLKEEAMRIAKEALGKAHNVGHARELITMACHAYTKNQTFPDKLMVCMRNNTIDSIAYLKKYYGGVSMPGDVFDDIVSRIAWATLCVEAFEYLDELLK